MHKRTGLRAAASMARLWRGQGNTSAIGSQVSEYAQRFRLLRYTRPTRHASEVSRLTLSGPFGERASMRD